MPALFRIDPGLCLPARFAVSGCGARAAACPGGAVAIDGAERPEPLSRPRTRAWSACPRHPKGRDGRGPCLQAPGMQALAGLLMHRAETAPGGEGALFAPAPRIDAAFCTGCGVWVRLCPTGALSLIKAGRDGMAYASGPARCSGRGVCSESCGEGAIRIESFSPDSPPMGLSGFFCGGCGVSVQVPAAGPRAGAALCPVCPRSPRRRPVRALQ